MELFESDYITLNFQSEFACEMTETAKHSCCHFKSQFASSLDSFHNSLVISDGRNGEPDTAENVVDESDNRKYSFLEEDHQSEQVNHCTILTMKKKCQQHVRMYYCIRVHLTVN